MLTSVVAIGFILLYVFGDVSEEKTVETEESSVTFYRKKMELKTHGMN